MVALQDTPARSALIVDREPFYDMPLFSGVPRTLIDEVLDGAKERTLEPGALLLSPEMENQHLYLVAEGRLQVHLGDVNKMPVAVIGSGECAGEMSVIDSTRPSAFVVAVETSKVLEVSRGCIWRLIDASEGLARNLLHVLSERLRSNNDVLTNSIRQQHELQRDAQLDPLTALFNRRWLDRALSRLVAASVSEGTPLTLVLLDVDHFKHFNDSHGHQAGDQALKRVASVIQAGLRPHDAAARYGGEEFALLLPSTDLAQGFRVAERLREAVRSSPLGSLHGNPLPSVSVSAGVAQLQQGEGPSELIAHADRALYRAKQAGRDCVRAAED